MNPRFSFIVSSLLAVSCLTSRIQAAEPIPKSGELPRTPATPAELALSTFELKEGFVLQLVASEPLVADPIAMAFDENGRMYVIEMHGYPERRGDRLGRIKLLEDTNGDGRFDKSIVFAKGLSWPSAIHPYDGGLLVGAVPDMFYLKDTDGDGVSDERKDLYTGFISGTKERDIAPRCFNSFTWGLDNRIHAASSMNGGVVRPAGDPDAEPLDLRRRDFSFDPRDMKLRPETGSGQYGLSFNARGRKFLCSNHNHIQTVMYDERYAGRNPFYTLPTAKVDIGVDGSAAEIFRISGDEPWRVLRMRWRIAGEYNGGVEAGGKISGYFTSACGITIYNGNALPPEMVGNAFIASPANNLVHRKLVREQGVSLVAERPADERDREFLASRDQWFRPVKFANAPDGALYVADMYREIIEVAHAIPDSIKERVDVYSGTDRGRIYRIAPKGFKPGPAPRLGDMSNEELVATLEHANGWHRETAARLLLERGDDSIVPALTSLLDGSTSVDGRLSALYQLNSLSAVKLPHLLRALSDPDPGLREHGIRLAEQAYSGMSIPARQRLVAELKPLAADPDAFVRYQLAFSVGLIESFESPAILADLARQGADDEWMRRAILNSLGDGGILEVFEGVAQADGGEPSAGFRRELVQMIGFRNKVDEVEATLEFAAKTESSESAFVALGALAEGLRKAKSSLHAVDKDGRVEAIFGKATSTVANAGAAELARVAAIRLLGWAKFEVASKTLLPLLDGRQSQAVQLAALESVGRFSEPEIGVALMEKWSFYTPRLRSEVVRMLLKRSTFTYALLDGIAKGVVRKTDISSNQIKFLQNHRSKDVRKLANAALVQAPFQDRGSIVKFFRPALELRGNVDRGGVLFMERCASCHKMGSLGYEVGPDLATIKNAGREELLTHIVDPNREVGPNFVSYLVETKDGESALGIVVGESAASVTLRQPFGAETVIQRSDIARIQSQGKSTMPEGLEVELSQQQMADLIEYLLDSRSVN